MIDVACFCGRVYSFSGDIGVCPQCGECADLAHVTPAEAHEMRREPDAAALAAIRIRDAAATEACLLEALQRRSSDVWEAYREQLAAHPDAIELPKYFIENGWVRVAVADDETPIGFSVVMPSGRDVHELDGLFVEPDNMLRGSGRALIEDAAARASDAGAQWLEVTVGPAQGFYERVGFELVGPAQTRFGPAVRMRRRLHRPPNDQSARGLPATHGNATAACRSQRARDTEERGEPRSRAEPYS